MARPNVHVIKMYRPADEMSTAEILGHLLTQYVSMVRNMRSDIGLKAAATAERSYVYLVTELADRFGVDVDQVVAMANTDMEMSKEKGGGNAPS